MIVLGINAYHPDASVALFKDGDLVWAAEEERFNRIKHVSGFPVEALRNCLTDLSIHPSSIDAVAISRNPRAHFTRKILYAVYQKPSLSFLVNRVQAFRKASRFERDFFEALKVVPATLKCKFINVEHHRSHAASSFFLSGFDRAAFMTLDGLGDFSSAMWGVGQGNQLRPVRQVFFPHSAGFLYTAGTQFLGFHHFGDEYKVMGLAAYGEPVFLKEFRRMVHLKKDGRFELALSYFVHHKGRAKVRWQGGVPEQDILFSKKWTDAFGAPRRPGQPLTETDKNIAASLQAVLEDIYFHLLNHLYKETKEKRLCLAGGVAFNSVANGKIAEETPFKEVYIQPAAGDSGTAIGAASFVYHSIYNKPRHVVMDHAYYGPRYEDEEIEKELQRVNLSYEKLPEAALLEKTAQAISEGKVIGWFQGRMEIGPRALGNRSILADPRRKDMKDILNQRIKNREGFRPFAPAVLKEKAADYFEMDCVESPFMLKVFPVRPEKQSAIPAVTHVDGTARIQTVSQQANPLFWRLIKSFEKQTGVPMLLNTSFNESEPIVCSPHDATQCFLKTRMDLLIIGPYWSKKRLVLS